MKVHFNIMVDFKKRLNNLSYFSSPPSPPPPTHTHEKRRSKRGERKRPQFVCVNFWRKPLTLFPRRLYLQHPPATANSGHLLPEFRLPNVEKSAEEKTMMMRKEEKKEGKKREPVKISRHNRVQTAVRTGFSPPLLLQWPHSTSHAANANGTKNPPGACQDASGKWEREGGRGWGGGRLNG